MESNFKAKYIFSRFFLLMVFIFVRRKLIQNSYYLFDTMKNYCNDNVSYFMGGKTGVIDESMVWLFCRTV
jgi:hypothetical protein